VFPLLLPLLYGISLYVMLWNQTGSRSLNAVGLHCGCTWFETRPRQEIVLSRFSVSAVNAGVTPRSGHERPIPDSFQFITHPSCHVPTA
jgi:hypothetical protein